MKKITKSHNHHHFWIENNVIHETYKTIRGLRFCNILKLDFEYPDKDFLTENDIDFLNNIIDSKI